MSDILEKNGATPVAVKKPKSFFKKIGEWIKSFDEAVHETPIKRVEDLFAIIGISAAVNRSYSFIGVFAAVLSIVLDRSAALWGWITENWGQVQTGLQNWTPFTQAQNEPLVVMAARRLRNYHHLYRSLIILCIAGISISLGAWLVVIAGLPGLALLFVALVIIFIWSISMHMAHVFVVPLLSAFALGSIALVPCYFGWHFWVIAFCIFTIFVSVSMLAALLWPIYVIARYFSTFRKKDVANVNSADKQSQFITERRWLSIKDYALSNIKALFWPLSLMVYAIMFKAWEIPVHYLSVIFVILALACAGIKTVWIRKVLNSMTVGNLFAFIGLLAFTIFVPADMKTSLEYQTKDYGYDAVGIYSFRTDAKYYWDVNNNSRPDTVDLRFLQDGLTDSLVFPRADRRFADVNGDGKSTDADMVYFKRFMDEKGPWPVKAGWLGTPKPGVLAAIPTSTPVQQMPPVQPQFAPANGGASEVKTVMATSSTWVEIGEFTNKLSLTTNNQINLGGYEVNANGSSSNPRRPMIPADETNLVYQRYRLPIPFGALVYLITGDAKVTTGQHFICPEGIIAYGSMVEMEGSRFRVQAMVSDSYYSDNSRSYNIAVVL
ncbi:MAG: hypothetical protein V1668_00345 [Patescibacteria group bacterium]